ncbi:hypothetical protein BSN85_23140 [Bradyrhizobium brasilense]|nr:hypothetical protein BSN85_23140 [Bradyrhizobium brasilense]
MVQNGSFQLPFTQANLADACSLYNVHINRTLQDLRRRGLIKWEGRTVTLLDREQLEGARRIRSWLPPCGGLLTRTLAPCRQAP